MTVREGMLSDVVSLLLYVGCGEAGAQGESAGDVYRGEAERDGRG